MRAALQTTSPTMGELFANGREYEVPAFQRNYSWSQTEWEDLWNDILAVEQKDSREHYLGAIVLRRKAEDDRFEVIDGQQRLASLSIVVLAILAEFEDWARAGFDSEENEKRKQLFRERLIAPQDPSSLSYRSRLRLNRADNAFFQSALVNGEEPVNERRLSKSNRALWSAWRYFRAKVKEHFAEAHDGVALAKFVDHTLSRRLVFIEIVVDDEAAAYTVFETLNARGVALGTADLLKNYLFAKVAGGGPADIEEMERRWDRLIEIVPLDQVAELVHHHANTEALNVSKRDVFRRVRETVTSKKAAFEYLERLTKAADWYAAFMDPRDERWLKGTREWVRVLAVLRAEQFRPTALAAAPLLADDQKGLEKLFRVLAIYTLRANVVLRTNTGDIYRTWNRVAVEITRSGRTGAGAVARAARSIYGDDDAFTAGFAELSIPASGVRKKLLRYLLAELETDASGRPVDWETDPFTIEHIMPESIEASSDPEFDELEPFLHRIGNYLPLEASLNREADRKPFAEKVRIYATSGYASPKKLAGVEWGVEAIRQRSQRCAERAVKIWRVDP